MAIMLTTIDNPYDPFDEFDKWYDYDVRAGHNTCSYLARIAKTSSSLSEDLNREETERAIDEICEINVNGLFRKVIK